MIGERRRTKIVATIGPASSSHEMVRALAQTGVDAMRLNFSHGTQEDHATRAGITRAVQAELSRPLALIADLQGPKLRIGDLPAPRVLETGELVVIAGEEAAQPGDLPVAPSVISQVLTPGNDVLIDDGLVRLTVERVEKGRATCRVIAGGEVKGHKGVNLPGVPIPIPSLTPKDLDDLEFALALGVDYIALSFVREAKDIHELREIIDRHGSQARIIAKIEKAEAVEVLDDVLDATDAVMVARGDLGVEMGAAKVPLLQKRIILRSLEAGKPVITATQMLESMIENPRPTRAEASDVANAIFDGTDSVMLSAETASGRYPREAVAMMARIVVEAESNMDEFMQPRRRRESHGLSVAETICESIAHAAEDLPMGAIAVFTETGNTARMISKFRPQAPIYAFTHIPSVVQRANLFWGVHPIRCRHALSTDQMVQVAEKELLARRVLKPGAVLGVVAGTQQASGSTNFMRLHTVTAEEASAATSSPRRRKTTGKRL
jgi:pyruvate kinase